MSAEPSTSTLHGKTALVTGGSRGIGEGIAIHFARKGISAIAITYLNGKKPAEEVLAKCRSLGVSKAIAIQADILDPQVGPNLIRKVLDGLQTQTLDIVVNNAVINDLALLEPFASTTLDTFGKTMQGNVFAPFSIINATLPHLPPKGGRIINISSIASKMSNPDPIVTYGASKAALDSITRSLAGLLAQTTKATFNTVSVGATNTDAVKAIAEQVGEESFLAAVVADFTVEKRIAQPEDVAFVVGFLASEEGRWINGAQIAANGGHRMLMALQG